MIKDFNIDSLNEEDLNYLIDREIQLFTQIKDCVVRQMNETSKNMSEQPEIITNIKVSPLAKVLIVAKKIVKNAVLSKITGIDPYFFDNDISMLRNNSMESCMKCDLVTLGYSAAQDFVDGINKVIELLSGPNSMEMLKHINTFYESLGSYFYDEYNAKERKDYSVFFPSLFFASGIYDQGKCNKLYAMAKRGVNLNMTIDFYNELMHIYEDSFSKKNQMGR